jgi:hypothetical protein
LTKMKDPVNLLLDFTIMSIFNPFKKASLYLSGSVIVNPLKGCYGPNFLRGKSGGHGAEPPTRSGDQKDS